MQKITPCLWFDDRIEEAAHYYAKLFTGTVKSMSRYPDGRVLTASVDMLDLNFTLLNGGPQFHFSEAISFYVNCKDQAEVDQYWDTIVADGGQESMCGWCKDKYGVSWQICPEQVQKTVGGPNPEGAARAMKVMMTMHKLVIADLEKAYAG